jgi:hypothetical protein
VQGACSKLSGPKLANFQGFGHILRTVIDTEAWLDHLMFWTVGTPAVSKGACMTWLGFEV